MDLFSYKKLQKGLFILGTQEADVARCAHVVDHARPHGRRRGHVDSVGLTFDGLTSTVGSGLIGGAYLSHLSDANAFIRFPIYTRLRVNLVNLSPPDRHQNTFAFPGR